MGTPKPRSDGWTTRRQLAFLDALARTRSVAKAARAAGMSRESAYRLRAREPAGLFAATWAHISGPSTHRSPEEVVEGHMRVIRRALGAEGKNSRHPSARPSRS